MLTLKPASTQDIATIQRLAHAIWHQHYVPIIRHGQVNYMLSKYFTTRALQSQMDNGQEFHLVMIDDQPAGFIGVTRKGDDSYFLNKFYLLEEKQGKGLGSAVFKKVFTELYPADVIRLTVNRQNFKSINFYFKLGFKIESVEDFDIDGGYFMNDFVMVWHRR